MFIDGMETQFGLIVKRNFGRKGLVHYHTICLYLLSVYLYVYTYYIRYDRFRPLNVSYIEFDTDSNLHV